MIVPFLATNGHMEYYRKDMLKALEKTISRLPEAAREFTAEQVFCAMELSYKEGTTDVFLAVNDRGELKSLVPIVKKINAKNERFGELWMTWMGNLNSKERNEVMVFIKERARMLEIKYVVSSVHRNPKAYARLFRESGARQTETLHLFRWNLCPSE